MDPSTKDVTDLTQMEEDKELEDLFKYWKKQPKVKPTKGVTFAQLDQDNNCHRCGKKVYPVEKLDVGVLYHKGCFKCLVCSRQLTLANFQRDWDLNNSRIKEVYCNSHVPRQGAGHYDQEALGIRAAIDAQRRASKKVQRHAFPDHGYIPDYPQRGSGDWSASSGGSGSRPPSDLQEPEVGFSSSAAVAGASEEAEEQPGTLAEVGGDVDADFLPIQPAPSAERAPIASPNPMVGVPSALFPVPPEVASAAGVGVAGDQFAGSGVRDSVTGDMLPESMTETEEGAARRVLLRRQESASQRNSTIRRRSTLRSFKDFEKFGVFDAQTMLEKAQRQEEDQLYSQIETERRALRMRLEECLRSERDRSVKELVKFFEKNGVGQEERQEALVKIEEYYRRRREAALRALFQRLAGEEQAAVARMVEKHSNEMIQLIRKKERLASQTMPRPDTSRPTTEPAPVTTTPSPGLPDTTATSVPLAATEGATSTPRNHQQASPVPVIMSPTSAFSVPQRINTTPKKTPLVLQITPIRPSPQQQRHQQQQNQQQQQNYNEEDDEYDVSSVMASRLSTLSMKESEGSGVRGSGVRGEGVGGEGVGVEVGGGGASDPDEDPSEGVPEAEPPVCPKDKLFTNPDIFKEQDRRAIEESKKDHKTFTDLVRQLSKRCQTELQKVRAIFRWVTVKDLNQMKFDERLDPNSPLGLLRGIKIGTESYHDLFRRLCSYAGLHCEVIEGFSKGAGYRPGDWIQGDTFRNQWTAVWVDGSWRFINCKWGARHVKATRDTSLTYKCDEFYFLTDPEDHIYQHLPDDPMWQLLPEPISLNDFMRLPVLKSPFFNTKLTLARPYGAVLETEDGQVEVRFKSQKLFGMAAKLKSTNRDIPSEILSERTVVRFTPNGEFVIAMNLPSPGTYFLDVYVASEWDSESMDNACVFQVRCSGVSRNADLSYPPVGCFGQTPAFIECGLGNEDVESNHPDPYIQLDGGTDTLSYTLTKNVSLRTSLRRWDARDRSMTDYDRYALYRQRTSHSAIFDLQFPRRGLYVFSLYVINPEDPSSSAICLERLLYDCQFPQMDAKPFPKASKRFKHCRVVEPLEGDLSPETEVTFRMESKRAVDMMVVFNNKSHGLKNSGTRMWQRTVHINVPTGKVMVYGRFDANSDKYIPLLEYHIANTRKYPSLC